jgi:hypothetical protein
MRIDFSVLGFLEFACYAIIFGFLWRMAAAHLSDRPLGKAMATIY